MLVHAANKRLCFTEVGVYDGVNAYRLLSWLSQADIAVVYHGFDLFEYAKDADLSEDNPGIHAELRRSKDAILAMHQTAIKNKLSSVCNNVFLYKGPTEVTLRANASNIKDSDIFYVDGGHSYKTVRSDFDVIISIAKRKSIIVFDDISWPGVAKLLNEINVSAKLSSIDCWRSYLVVT